MSRAAIPDPIKLKLWVLSGGRCEFPGCNKYVWRDGLTLQEDNFAHMAHIIAASPDGPRGDQELSPEMAQDFDNLMLICLDHSHLIDGRNKTDYAIEDLRRHKQAHEDRIRRQTDLQPDMTTTVLRFTANIGDRPVSIPLASTYHAILPRFPADDKGILMDFTNRNGRGEENFWQSFASDIIQQAERGLAEGNDRPRPTNLSLFAIGPIPALIQLGQSIGNTISANIYQRHRDTEDWAWKAETDEPFEYQVKEVPGTDSKNIALVLSLSGNIHLEEVYKIFKDQPHLYEITISNPNLEFLTQQSRLNKFREIYRGLLTQIRDLHGGDATIHLFPAIPCPVAVVCGRELLPKSDPNLIVYDNEKAAGGFVKILTIN